LTVSLALVAVADVFMGFFDGDPKFVTAGVAFFSIVQLTYFCCMTARRGGKPAFRDRHFKISLIVRAAATIAIIGVCIALFLLENGVFFSKPYLIIITGFYFVNAVVNLAYACVYIKQNPVVPAAILLLVLCDTFLGLTFLGIFSGGGYLSKVNISWILYLPSQALITLSGLYKRNLSPVLRPAEPQKDDVSRKHFYENNLENSAANNLGNVNENE
jgi:heme/copper-type cytochrome/quinol oxidase subunit 4